MATWTWGFFFGLLTSFVIGAGALHLPTLADLARPAFYVLGAGAVCAVEVLWRQAYRLRGLAPPVRRYRQRPPNWVDRLRDWGR